MEVKTVYIAFSDNGEHIRYWTTSPEDAARFAEREGVSVTRFDGTQLQRQPLAASEIEKVSDGMGVGDLREVVNLAFLAGVRFAESAHKICKTKPDFVSPM